MVAYPVAAPKRAREHSRGSAALTLLSNKAPYIRLATDLVNK